jgi:hypothetical protein
MDIVQNCDSYVNIPLSQTYRPYFHTVLIQIVHGSPQASLANNCINLLLSEPLLQPFTPALFSLWNHVILL